MVVGEIIGGRIQSTWPPTAATELLTPGFMQAHTREYNAAEEWVDASPFKIESSEDFAAIPDADWDAYVKATTDFSSWEEMLGEAGEELVGRSPFRG